MKPVKKLLQEIPYFGIYALKEANRQNKGLTLNTTANKCSEALIGSFSFCESKEISEDTWWQIYDLLNKIENLAESKLKGLNN